MAESPAASWALRGRCPDMGGWMEGWMAGLGGLRVCRGHPCEQDAVPLHTASFDCLAAFCTCIFEIVKAPKKEEGAGGMWAQAASPAPAVCFLHGLLTELHELPGAPLSSAVWPEPPSSARGWCMLCALTLRVPCCSPGLVLPLGCYCPLLGCPAAVQEPDPPLPSAQKP